jgi:hypothetical protein
MPFTILPAVPAGTITDNILPPPLICTEKTLDLIAKVGTQVGNGLDVTVKYIDDKTGNVASAK